MNKEQWVFLLGLVLLGYGVVSGAMGWLEEKPFQPPAASRSAKGPEKGEFQAPIFPSEDDLCAFAPSGRDPFQKKRETEPLPPAVLARPPLAAANRVAPGPAPGLGNARLRPLEEPLPTGSIDLAAKGPEEEDEGEGEDEDDEWGRRRW